MRACWRAAAPSLRFGRMPPRDPLSLVVFDTCACLAARRDDGRVLGAAVSSPGAPALRQHVAQRRRTDRL